VIDAVEAAFPEDAKEESEENGGDEGKIHDIHMLLNRSVDKGSREKVTAVIYISILNIHNIYYPI
jgi:hypothetical protein